MPHSHPGEYGECAWVDGCNVRRTDIDSEQQRNNVVVCLQTPSAFCSLETTPTTTRQVILTEMDMDDSDYRCHWQTMFFTIRARAGQDRDWIGTCDEYGRTVIGLDWQL